jgi:hypothetical protein
MNCSKNIEIVISRYNENLHWLNHEPFNKYKNIIYNKGPNDDFYKTNNIKVVNLENIGRCDHTYLFHIIENYDNLADITVFLPGSIDISNKTKKAILQVELVEKHQNTVFIGGYYDNVKRNLYDFKLDIWSASHPNNCALNNECQLTPANIRPFGKWYDTHFPGIDVQYTSNLGILGISKDHILQHKKSYYENLIKELNNSSNPEVGHYFERSWNAVFYPLDGAAFIQMY